MNSFFNRTTITIITIAAVAALGASVVYIFSDIITYLVISFAIAAVLRTPTNYISQIQIFGLRLPRTIAILASYAMLAGLIALFVLLFAPLVSAQIEAITGADQKMLDNVLEPIEEVENFLIEKDYIEPDEEDILSEGEFQAAKDSVALLLEQSKLFYRTKGLLIVPDQVVEHYGFQHDLLLQRDASGEFIVPVVRRYRSRFVASVKEFIRAEWGKVKNEWKTDRFSGIINDLLSFTGNFFVTCVAVIFITFFILLDRGSIRKYFLSLVPNRYFEVTIVAVTKIERSLSNYLLGILLQMISIFSIASFGLIIIGIDYAVTIAAFAAVMNVIPFLGPILGASFGIIVGIGLPTSETSLVTISSIIIVFVIVQLMDNLFLQPMIFSRSVKAHPLEIFLIVFVGATLAGALGMILAIPVYTIVKVSVTEFLLGYRKYRVFRQGMY